jgi:nitrilase
MPAARPETDTAAGPFLAAIVQQPPALLDRDTTLKRAIEYLDEAAGRGARLVVFPETYVPGYPEYIWRLRPGDEHEHDLAREIHGRLLANAVDLETDDLAPVREAAGRLGATVVIGVHERDGRFSRASVFNTLVTIGPDGSVWNRHRKLVPTNPERMVWSPGDGSGLRVLDSPVGRLGGLICWENYMPLARFSLYAQGIQVYVASTWDEGDGWIASMRHIAQEGRCWVLGAGCSIQAKDVPADFPDRERLYPDPQEWLNAGDSVVVAPQGEIVAGPLHREHGVLYAEIDPAAADAAHYTLDVAGHYHRPDVFRLTVDRSPRDALAFEGEDAPANDPTGGP